MVDNQSHQSAGTRIARFADGYPFAVGSVLLVAAALLPFRPVLSPPTVMLVFVPVIIGVARAAGIRASALAAALAFICLDLLFVVPYYHLSVASPSEWIGLLVFLIVALVSGRQTALMRRREQVALRRQEELALLNRLSFRIASEQSATAIAQFVVHEVNEVLPAQRVALYVRGAAGSAPACIAQEGLPRTASSEAALVSWVLRTSKAVGMTPADGVPFDQRIVSVPLAEAIPGVEAEGVYVPLQAPTGLEGVLVAEPASSVVLSADDSRLLAAVANLAATSLERQRLEEDAAHAQALTEADRLKSTLVSSVSHELKTPLAAATARVTGLLEEGAAADSDRVNEELSSVAEDLGRLNDSIGDLLDLSRLESDAWEPHFEDYEVRDILGTVLSRLSPPQRDRVRFELADDLPEVRVDFAQMARAISNLVENALAYSPQGLPVTVGANSAAGEVRLWVEDRGPGVPDAEKPRLFEKFYRGSTSEGVPSGTGLGLAITREIVRTHDGRVWVEDAPGNGARFVMTLPEAGGDS